MNAPNTLAPPDSRCPDCDHTFGAIPCGDDGRYTCPECGRSLAETETTPHTRRRQRGWAWWGLPAMIVLAPNLVAWVVYPFAQASAGLSRWAGIIMLANVASWLPALLVMAAQLDWQIRVADRPRRLRVLLTSSAPRLAALAIAFAVWWFTCAHAISIMSAI